MSIVADLLTVGFAVAFVGYYALVWAIRGERVALTPSVFQMLRDPLSVLAGDFTERGRRLRRWLLLDFALLVVLGLGVVLTRTHPHAFP